MTEQSTKAATDTKRAARWAPGSEATTRKVFDYRTQRFLVGVVALSLTWIVTFTANEKLISISSSYHTDARNWLVGMLFVVGAFLFSYNGHFRLEGRLSRVGSIAAFVVALVPSAPKGSPQDLGAHIHLGASAILFLVLAYFCLFPFRKNTKGKGGKKGIRATIYLVCGLTMLGALGTASVLTWTFERATIDSWRAVYWSEAIALHAFGIAWMTSGKVFPFLVDKEEGLSL